MKTVRECLEAIRDDDGEDDDFAYIHAIAALRILNEADWDEWQEDPLLRVRLIPDPKGEVSNVR